MSQYESIILLSLLKHKYFFLKFSPRCHCISINNRVNISLMHHVISPMKDGVICLILECGLEGDKVSSWRSAASSRVNIRALCGRLKMHTTGCRSTIAHFNCRVTVSCRAKVSATLRRSETRAWPCSHMWVRLGVNWRSLQTQGWKQMQILLPVYLVFFSFK